MVLKNKTQKQLQVAEQIKRKLADIFLREDIFKSGDFKVTISEADISPDLKNAKVFVNIFGEVNSSSLLAELNKNSYYFQKKVGNYLKLRNIPKINFILDESLKNAHAISKAIDQEGSKLNSD